MGEGMKVEVNLEQLRSVDSALHEIVVDFIKAKSKGKDIEVASLTVDTEASYSEALMLDLQEYVKKQAAEE